jgi:hypothetical protein
MYLTRQQLPWLSQVIGNGWRCPYCAALAMSLLCCIGDALKARSKQKRGPRTPDLCLCLCNLCPQVCPNLCPHLGVHAGFSPGSSCSALARPARTNYRHGPALPLSPPGPSSLSLSGLLCRCHQPRWFLQGPGSSPSSSQQLISYYCYYLSPFFLHLLFLQVRVSLCELESVITIIFMVIIW